MVGGHRLGLGVLVRRHARSRRSLSVLQVEILPYTGSSGVIDPQFSEIEVDAVRGPNPDLFISANDDIDALEFTWG